MCRKLHSAENREKRNKGQNSELSKHTVTSRRQKEINHSQEPQDETS